MGKQEGVATVECSEATGSLGGSRVFGGSIILRHCTVLEQYSFGEHHSVVDKCCSPDIEFITVKF